MGTSTFSSELAAEFDAACAADAAYTARLARGDREWDGDDRATSNELVTRDGRLFTRANGALYVPCGEALRTRLIRECHDSATAGHLGRDKTIEQMQRRFFWHGMTARVSEHVTTCDACQRNKLQLTWCPAAWWHSVRAAILQGQLSTVRWIEQEQEESGERPGQKRQRGQRVNGRKAQVVKRGEGSTGEQLDRRGKKEKG
jgi:hypothetical protein